MHERHRLRGDQVDAGFVPRHDRTQPPDEPRVGEAHRQEGTARPFDQRRLVEAQQRRVVEQLGAGEVRVQAPERPRGVDPALDAVVLQVPSVDVLEEQVVPLCPRVPARADERRHGQRGVAEEVAVDADLAVAALLLRVVGLLAAEMLREEGQLPAVVELERHDLRREERRVRTRLRAQRADANAEEALDELAQLGVGGHGRAHDAPMCASICERTRRASKYSSASSRAARQWRG